MNYVCSTPLFYIFSIHYRYTVWAFKEIFINKNLIWSFCSIIDISYMLTCPVSGRIPRANVTLAWATSKHNYKVVKRSGIFHGCCWFWVLWVTLLFIWLHSTTLDNYKTLFFSPLITISLGDARLAKNMKNKVFSFDLVSNDPSVVACDMSNVCTYDEWRTMSGQNLFNWSS